jgi:tetratricopeptide (TPR) repeat protein
MVFEVMEQWMVEELQGQVSEKQDEGDEEGAMWWSDRLAGVLRKQGRSDEAVACGERALQIARRILGDDDGRLSTYLCNLANTYKALGRFEDSLALEESMLELDQRVLAEDDEKIGDSMSNIAITYTYLGRHNDALAMNERALHFFRRVLPANHPSIGTCMGNLAATYSGLGRLYDALAMRESALEFFRRVLPANHPSIGTCMSNLAATYSDLGRHNDALELKESVLEFRRRVLPPSHPDIGVSLSNLAGTYSAVGRHSDALAMNESALEFRRRVLPPSHPDLASLLYNISGNCAQAGDFARAMECACEALRIWKAVLPSSHSYVSVAETRVRRLEGVIHEQVIARQDDSAHEIASQHMLGAGSVVILRHRGGGYADSDYTLHFRRSFNTFVADIKLSGGCFYWELDVVDDCSTPVQFGVCTEGFEARKDPAGEGVGDDARSWAVDGIRQLKWHEGNQGALGSAWAISDVIGFALDMRTAGAAAISVSVNGSFTAPDGPAFTAIDAPYLSPALTGLGGRYRLNLGDRPFAHAPPDDAEFVSVHAYHLQQRRRK